jgi:hypothetical protein
LRLREVCRYLGETAARRAGVDAVDRIIVDGRFVPTNPAHR